MNKFILFLLVNILSFGIVFANPNKYDAIYDGYQVTYNPVDNTWCAGGIADGEIILTKKLYDGAGSYSQYLNSEGKVVMTFTSDFEFIKDGSFIAINNAELKYNKIIYDGERFEEVPLTYSELQNLFPEAQIIDLAYVDEDNKMWVNKPFLKKKEILFINNSDRYFHKLTAKNSRAQNEDIRGLVTLSHYGIYRFTHFGERDGKLTLYVR